MTSTIFSLPPTLAIDEADALRGILLKSAAESAPGDVLTLDAGSVERLTTPGLQIICALEKSLIERQARLHITGASAAFIQTCRLLGFQTTYEKWSNATC